MSSVHGATSYNLSHTLQSIRRKFERRSFFVKSIDRAIATTVAIEATSGIGGYQLSLGEIELTKNITLLTKEVLLMVAIERGGGGDLITFLH